MNDHSTILPSRHVAAIAMALVVLALGGCSDDDDSSADTPATDAPTSASTAGPTTTPTTEVADTTTAPAEPTTTDSPTLEVAFETSGQQLTPLFDDPQAPSFSVSSNVSGDLVGPITSAMLNREGSAIALSWFEGSVADCGTGGLALRIGTRPDGATGWEIVAGLGTGELAGVTGSGIEVPPKFTGTITCNGDLGFATTLLTPEPTDPAAVECAPPDEYATTVQSQEVAMHPDQVAPARMVVEQAKYAETTYWGITVSPPAGETTQLVNTYAGLRVGELCGTDGIARILIDNLLLPDFHGAWDALPAVNDGTVGGGSVPGPGKVVSPGA